MNIGLVQTADQGLFKNLSFDNSHMNKQKGISKNPHFVTMLRYLQKYFLAYQLYAISIFFIRTWSCLEL